MNGWMFFPGKRNSERKYNQEIEVIFGTVPGLSSLSREEWHAYIPESKERAQGRTLGFFCGNGRQSGKKLFDFPDYPMRTFVSDSVIMPSCWTFNEVLSASPVPVSEYRVFPAKKSSEVITVTGTLPDRPPYVRVYGSYCFFPPPYRLRTGEKEKS
ncbi:MAG: hypothetical protein J5858_09620 [Lentisphaeria bacterium]|nr:hypothetical protein [Lentisphaeria bacterium]